jgi:hypothetical protein
MSKRSPKYVLHFRWNDFQLNIVGKSALLWCAAMLSLLIGARVFASKVIGLF